MDAVNDETLNQYFSLLKDVLTEHGILHSPSQIYNVDESGIQVHVQYPSDTRYKANAFVSLYIPI